MELKTTFEGPPIEKNGKVRMYHDGQEMTASDVIRFITRDGKPTIIDIHNDTPADMIEIQVKANFPIESADGPHTIPARGRGQVSIAVDTDKMIWFDDSDKQPFMSIEYVLVRQIGGNDMR